MPLSQFKITNHFLLNRDLLSEFFLLIVKVGDLLPQRLHLFVKFIFLLSLHLKLLILLPNRLLIALMQGLLVVVKDHDLLIQILNLAKLKLKHFLVVLLQAEIVQLCITLVAHSVRCLIVLR